MLSTDYLTYALFPYVSPATRRRELLSLNLIETQNPYLSAECCLAGAIGHFGMPSSVLYGWSHFCEWNSRRPPCHPSHAYSIGVAKLNYPNVQSAFFP